MKIGTCLLFLPLLLSGAENLVLNGTFTPGSAGFPKSWNYYYGSSTVGQVKCFASGGPDGKGFVRLKDGFTLRQKGVTLVNQEKYRVSAWIRTEGLDPGKSGFFFHRTMLCPLPANQAKWKFFEKEVVLDVKSRKGVLDHKPIESVLKVSSAGKVLDITDFRLEPVSPAAQKQSSGCLSSRPAGLVAGFLTDYVPLRQPEADFFWDGRIPPCGLEKLRCTVSAEGSGREYRPAFSGTLLRVRLTGLPAGKNVLRVRLESPDKKWRHEQKFPVRLIDMPPMPPGSRRLNNLVTELPEIALNGGNAAGTVVNPRYGWLYFRFKPQNGGAYELTLDGRELLKGNGPESECFRLLEPGRYPVAAAKGAGTLTVRLIAETYLFPIQRCPIASGKLDEDFINRYMMPAVTTFGSSNPGARPKDPGHLRLANLSISGLRKSGVEPFLEQLKKPDCRLNTCRDGVTLDEMDFAFDWNAFANYIEVFRRYENPEKKLMYTFVLGPVVEADRSFISVAANLSGGRGRLLHECYERTLPTEERARHSIRLMAGTMSIYRDAMPKIWPRVGMIFDLSSELPFRSVSHQPENDFKYYLDMLLHAAAVDPAFEGLTCVGYWGAHRARGETLRWALRLLRHYAIEGKTEKLSDRFGYSFSSDHVVNPDFDHGLDGWEANSAVSAGRRKDYGKDLQWRSRPPAGTGDGFAVLNCKAAEKPVLKQTLRDLKPGQPYSLSFMFAERSAVLKKKFARRVIQLNAALSDSRIVYETHVVPRLKQNLKICVNRKFLVFIPGKPEVELVFSADKESAVSEIVLNYIAVHPFYPEENSTSGETAPAAGAK